MEFLDEEFRPAKYDSYKDKVPNEIATYIERLESALMCGIEVMMIPEEMFRFNKAIKNANTSSRIIDGEPEPEPNEEEEEED
jgi:hypothetical protein